MKLRHQGKSSHFPSRLSLVAFLDLVWSTAELPLAVVLPDAGLLPKPSLHQVKGGFQNNSSCRRIHGVEPNFFVYQPGVDVARCF